MGSKKISKREQKVADLSVLQNASTPEKKFLIRTTLRLIESGHKAIDDLSNMYGMKNAEVFDYILQSAEKLTDSLSTLNMPDNPKNQTIRKTYLLLAAA